MERVVLVHISDLHLGSRISGSRGVGIRGSTAHDARAVEALSAALGEICRRPGKKALVISGDVSAWGGDAEFGLYRTLRDLGFARDAYLTLRSFSMGFEWVLDLPGNHDFWGGVPMNPHLSATCRSQYFDRPPWTGALVTRHYVVTLHGLCSTSGSSPVEQVLAVGAFRNVDLAEATASVRQARTKAMSLGKEPFPILVTHHSPRAGAPRGITNGALKGLIELTVDEKIQGLLTGHDHASGVVKSNYGLPVEVRCSTTTQANAPAQQQSREILVHEFLDDGPKTLVWRVTTWAFSGARFKSVATVTVPY